MTRVLFLGSKRIGLRVLKLLHDLEPHALVGAVAFDDSTDVRSALPEFDALCEQRHIALHRASTPAAADSLIAKFQPDLCFVVGWYFLFTRQVLQSVPRGFIGVHFSLLPRYRGSSPLVWALINGEREVGSSIFSLAQGVDNGDIWAQRRIAVGESEYIDSILRRLEDVTLEEITDKYRRILAGEIAPTPQDESQATYCTRRSPSDGEIDWTMSARRVFDFIRAQSRPYPGAFTYLNGNPISVWRAGEVSASESKAPGVVVASAPEGILVTCGDGHVLALQDVAWRGARPGRDLEMSPGMQLGRSD